MRRDTKDYDYHRKQHLHRPGRYTAFTTDRRKVALMLVFGSVIIAGLVVMSFFK